MVPAVIRFREADKRLPEAEALMNRRKCSDTSICGADLFMISILMVDEKRMLNSK